VEPRRYYAEGCGPSSHAKQVRAKRDPWIALNQRRDLHRAQGGLCAICGERIEIQFYARVDRRMTASTEHVIPLSLKGPPGLGNLVCAHRGCNEDKGDRPPTGCELIWLLAVNARMGVGPVRW